MKRASVTTLTFVVGMGLFAIAIRHADFRSAAAALRALGPALVLLFLPSLGWHLTRTLVWWLCFPKDARRSFARTFRIRIAAEAFSFVTISGLGGEPLKVMLLAAEVPPTITTAAVALERVAYLAVTASIACLASLLAVIFLPLSPSWMRIFSGLAIGCALAIAVPVGAMVAVSRSPRIVKLLRARLEPRGRMGRLVQLLMTVRDRMIAVLRESPSRLASLVALQVFAYFLMALEVRVALRVAHATITFGQAMTVETFTRMSSLGSAFIPVNLGALEASNAAAAYAVHAASAAGTLALVRRLRSLAWCVGGFLIFPRGRASRSFAADSARARRQWPRDPENGRVLAIVDDGQSSISVSEPLAGLPIGERILRWSRRAGYDRVCIWTATEPHVWSAIATRLDRPSVFITDDRAAWHRRLASSSGSITIWPSTLVPGPSALQDPLQINNRDTLLAAERTVRRAVFKPTDGLLARFNRRLSLPVSVAAIRAFRLSPHVMSVVVMALGFYSGWLFSRGDYAGSVLGATVSWLASVLDGCDGELARLQYRESSFGCWLDTLGDYTYYLAIFTGLTIGAVHQTKWPGFWWIGFALLAGTLLTFALLVLLRRRLRDQPQRLCSATKAHFYATGQRWKQSAATLSICATRATAPYGILLLACLNLAPLIVVVAAIGAQIYWLTLAVEIRTLLRSPTEAGHLRGIGRQHASRALTN